MDNKYFEIKIRHVRGDKEMQINLDYRVPVSYLGTIVAYLSKWRKTTDTNAEAAAGSPSPTN